MKKSIYLFVFTLLSTGFLTAQHFSFVQEQSVAIPATAAVNLPLLDYKTVDLSLSAIQQQLLQAPIEGQKLISESSTVIKLPLPNGTTADFLVLESSVMAPALQANWPQLRTYRLRHTKDPLISGRLAITPFGLTAVFNTDDGEVFIEPYASEQNRYHVVYYGDAVDLNALELPQHYHESHDIAEYLEMYEFMMEQDSQPNTEKTISTPATIQVYNLALTCTGEYARDKGGTVESVLASFVTGMAVANSIFEREVGVRMVLIEGTEDLIYLDPNDDPFFNTDEGTALLTQVQGAITSAGFPTTTYDIGHLFTSGCSDVAGVVSGRVCTATKDRGVTCHSSNNVSAIVRSIFVHEVGHQFAVGHSWSNCPGSEDQRANESAFEPGAGTTIMSYANLCGNQNLGSVDDYYHGHSVEQFIFYTREGQGSIGCATVLETGNTEPEVSHDYEDGFFIPISTPFELTGSATDAEDENLTYCWEQLNLGPVSSLGSPMGNAPSFRSYPPTENTNRVFPRMIDVVNNVRRPVEVLPTYSRDLTFRLTVRDNNEEVGATVWTDVDFDATDTAGPFLVTSPNTDDVVWEVGEYLEVNWDVANTDNSVVNCQRVNITLSTDGGFTYPITLVENTPNDGSAFITVPDAIGDEIRLRVDAADNIFFDISNEDFAIVPATAPRYTLNYGPQTQQICTPGEEVAVDFSSAIIGDFTETLIFDITSELPDGVESNIAASALTPGEDLSLTLNFDNSAFAGPLDVEVRTIAGLDTTFRTFDVVVVSTDFSDFALSSPPQGTTGIVLSTEFGWVGDDDATSYDFELSTSPLFGDDVVFSETGISATTFTPAEFQLESNSLYFWRVQPVNDCATEGNWSVPSVFQTELVTCTELTSVDVPKNIPGTGPLPTIISELTVSDAGQISDVSVANVNVAYNPTQNFEVRLRSPNMTEVLLYDQNCFFNDRIFLGFDSNSPDPIACPATDGSVYQPIGNLNDFVGQNPQGTWELEVKIIEGGNGSPGSIDGWGLEFCAAITPLQMIEINNNALEVPPGQTNPLEEPLLKVGYEDDSIDPVDFIYTIVQTPENGVLRDFFDNELVVGSTFTQAAIDALNIRYSHDNTPTTSDSFYFIATDGDGAFLPVQRFNIIIDDDAVVNTEEIVLLNELRVFPNPIKDQVTVSLARPLATAQLLRVYDVKGQLLRQVTMEAATSKVELPTTDWPQGVYLLQLGQQTIRLLKM